MHSYKVAWYIDVEADSAVEAANKALAIQRDRESLATVFSVSDQHQNKLVIDTKEWDPEDIWEVHPAYTLEEWVTEVANDFTRSGYQDWVKHQLSS